MVVAEFNDSMLNSVNLKYQHTTVLHYAWAFLDITTIQREIQYRELLAHPHCQFDNEPLKPSIYPFVWHNIQQMEAWVNDIDTNIVKFWDKKG